MAEYSYQSGTASQFMVQGRPSLQEGEVTEQGGRGGKKNKFRNMVPVEVRSLLQHREEEGPLFLLGLEVGLLQLVGWVRGVQDKECSTVYQLEDRTGRVEVMHWHQEEEGGAARPAPALRDSLVKVVGELRSGREQPWVTAYRVTHVTSGAEADAHLLEVAVLPLRLRRLQERAAAIAQAGFGGQGSLQGLMGLPDWRLQGPALPRQAAAVAPSHSGDWGRSAPSPAIAWGRPASSPAIEPAAVELLSLIKSSRSEMGATRQELRGRGRSSQARLEELLDFLAQEGYVYTTCDQDHFKSTDA